MGHLFLKFLEDTKHSEFAKGGIQSIDKTAYKTMLLHELPRLALGHHNIIDGYLTYSSLLNGVLIAREQAITQNTHNISPIERICNNDIGMSSFALNVRYSYPCSTH